MSKSKRQNGIEKHPDRDVIEACLCRRVPLRKLEAKYGLDIGTLSRHRTKMRSERPKAYAALEAKDWSCTPEELEKIKIETKEGFIVKLKSQVDKLVAAQDQAIEDDRYASGAQIAGQVHAALRMLGEATGGLGLGGTHINVSTSTNVTYTAEFHELRTTILTALRSYPEALKCVLAALRAGTGALGDGGSAPPPPPTIEHFGRDAR